MVAKANAGQFYDSNDVEKSVGRSNEGAVKVGCYKRLFGEKEWKFDTGEMEF